MIAYLNGLPIERIKLGNERVVLILEVAQVGYEIQVPYRWVQTLPLGTGDTVQVFTHLQLRDDRPVLYGFPSAAERELFRQLISVSGIGAQSAIALIDVLGLESLVQAVVTGDIRLLTKAPGVGKKTAERLALELKTKLSKWREAIALATPATPSVEGNPVLEDLELTLLALGYSDREIGRAIATLSHDPALAKIPEAEVWIKQAIAWLSDNVSQ